ncbi:DUF6318 family protein [Geodermatophilus sp. CPCC 205506]|uniref:DUF6318 family protein n=1 Tax=Geodermatophilus sp. CPCC 205506 TaxID=2936596 RepID=UPI003EEB28EA
MDDVARRATLRLVAGMTIGVALLGGCAEEQPASDTLPAASAEAEPSDADLPPLGPADFPVPPKAREKTPEGAAEFMRYYMDLNAYVAEGPRDPSPLLELSQECAYCRALADSYRNDLSAGYTYAPLSYEYQANGPGLVSGDAAEVGFVYSQGAFQTYDSNGQLVPGRSGPASGALQSGAHLAWNERLDTWIVTSMTVG